MRHAKDHIVFEPKGYEGCGQCHICGAAEGQLLTWCPGYPLNHDTLEACYNGNVKDFGSHQQKLRVAEMIRNRDLGLDHT